MSKRKPAFTLIELLVVITIISLLLSVLLPALHSARSQAKRVYCAHNIKTLNFSALLSTADHEDRLLTKELGMSFLYQHYLGLQMDIAAGFPDLRDMFDGYLDGYMDKSKPSPFMFCPSAQAKNDRQRRQLGYDQAPNRWNSGVFTMGYTYWAANEEKVLDVLGLDWYSEADPAYRITDKAWKVLFSDPLELDTSTSPGIWRLASHTKSQGTTENTTVDPVGQNNARLDGSVDFMTFVENDAFSAENYNRLGELEAATYFWGNLDLPPNEQVVLLWGGIR